MKVLKIICCTIVMMLFVEGFAAAQVNGGSEYFKKYINKITEKAEEAENAGEKRALLNRSFDHLAEAIDRVEKMKHLSGQDLAGIEMLRNNIAEKKDELNGANGFERVKDNQLDEFTDYVQQDLEQAQTVITLSLGVAILIAILLLML